MIRRTRRLALNGWRALRRALRTFWRPPDPLLVDVADSGEMTVAKIRFVVVGFFLIEMLLLLWIDGATSPARLGTTASVVAAAIAFVIYLLVKRDRHQPWIGFASSILDVTLVSGVLVAFVVIGRPEVVILSQVWFAIYILAIAATSLRYDPRICALTGVIAIVQYTVISGYAGVLGGIDSPEFGRWGLYSFFGSVLLLGCVTWISAGVVLRTQRLRLLSAKDLLTGLVARGFFLEMARAELYRAQRYDRKFALALIDVDHFKSFNDSFGHTVGDEVLRLIAQMLQSGRKSDIVGRYGGEEFLILFPETDGAGAAERADQLRSLVATSGVTVSVGTAEFPADGSDLETVIDSADQRLYEAKHTGRNKVVGG